MTIISNARTTTFVNAMTDTKALVTCKDVFGIATMGTDFIFDALNPLCYLNGALPSESAAIPTAGVLGGAVTAAGSGGANGTFALGISGGGGSGAAGIFTVAGGVLTSVDMTAYGSGYTSNPVFSFAASAGLTGATVSIQLASLLNLARDTQPALSRTKPVGLLPMVGGAGLPVFANKGINFVNNTSGPLSLRKAGLLNGKACEPYHEGFIDYLEMIVFNAAAWPIASLGLLLGTGGGCGIQFGTNGIPASKETGVPIGAAVPTGKIATIAKRVRLNVGANTSTIIGYVGVDGIATASASLAGKVPTSYTTGTTGVVYVGGGGSGAATACTGRLHYVYREMIGTSVRTDADILDLVNHVHTTSLTRYA